MPKKPKSPDRFLALPIGREGMQAVLAESAQIFDRHTHDAYAFGLIDRGGQRWHSGRGQVEGLAGDVIMSNPGEVHDGSPIGDRRTWRMLHVEPSVVWDAVAQLGHARPRDYEFANPVVQDLRLAQLMGRLVVASIDPTQGLRADELLLYLVGQLGQFRAPSSGVSRIDQAKARIDDCPAGTLSLAELARECGLSQWQLLRSFARVTGFTPHAYQMQRRIELARKLIVQGFRLAEASTFSGFADQSHMTRTFRRKYGFSPRAWAASQRMARPAPVMWDPRDE